MLGPPTAARLGVRVGAPLAADLVERILADDGRDAAADAGPLAAFLAEPRTGEALILWFGASEAARVLSDREALALAIDRDIARIDALLSAQLDAILHAPRLQALEATWRGVAYLVEQADQATSTRIRILDIAWAEVCRDLERAIEFDQSQMFQKIYEQEFGMPGGEPFGVLLGAYEMRHAPAPDHSTDDVAGLKGMMRIAAAAFAPFITAAHPGLLGLESFAELGLPIDVARGVQAPDYARWNAMRDLEEARFLGVTVPRVLMRLPWADDGSRADGFRYREDASSPDLSGYCWGPAIFAFAGTLIRAFESSGWFAEIRGAARDGSRGGLVTDLPIDHFGTDRPGVGAKLSTDVELTDAQEEELSRLGLMTLCRARDTPYAVFHGNPSLQRPERYDRPVATANARLSAMLQYIFCISRFAHCVKVIGRDRIGAFQHAEDCQEFLRRWLLDYSIASDTATTEERARYPLREVDVAVRELPGRPGLYSCVIHLQPHFQLDQVASSFRLVTELAAPGPRAM
ncbi:type VI secretion system contractile sheath large subunit [Inquilinus sp. NPDC058860]|uniref:type VI secretion system contractile sheath large subunit n=1 Tax=Inquilinus sp. NPDC058860 TaxID=3346652 RepID=UPI0036A24102